MIWDPSRGGESHDLVDGRCMKIYFCDSCHESLSLDEMKSDRTLIDAGRILCARCASSTGLAARRRRSWRLLCALALTFAAGALGGAIWGNSEPGAAAELEGVQRRLEALEKRLVEPGAGSSKAAKREARSQREMQAGLAALERRLDAISAAFVSCRTEIERSNRERASREADEHEASIERDDYQRTEFERLHMRLEALELDSLTRGRGAAGRAVREPSAGAKEKK